MTERQLLTDFSKIVRTRIKKIHWIKIADTFGGRKKPYDVYCVYKGRPIAIEFKKHHGGIPPHQMTNLIENRTAGGISLMGEFAKTVKNKKTERSLLFFDFNNTVSGTFILEYSEPGVKEKYPKLEEFFNWAVAL